MVRENDNNSIKDIEVTPDMIERGLVILERRGLNSLTTMTTYPEFVHDFLNETISGGLLRNS